MNEVIYSDVNKSEIICVQIILLPKPQFFSSVKWEILQKSYEWIA